METTVGNSVAQGQLISLATKLARIMGEVGGIEKKGRNKEQGYAFQRVTDLTAGFRLHLASAGIIVTQSELECEMGEFQTMKGSIMHTCKVKIRYSIRDGATGEVIEADGYGLAYDTSDKSLTKAKTSALKYFLKDLFMVPDEKDDADAVTPEEHRPSPAPTTKGPAPRPAPTSDTAGDFLDANISEVRDDTVATGKRKGEPYLWVVDGPKSWPCFDAATIGQLKGLVGENVRVKLAQGNKGKYIVGVESQTEVLLKQSIAAAEAKKARTLEVNDGDIPF